MHKTSSIFPEVILPELWNFNRETELHLEIWNSKDQLKQNILDEFEWVMRGSMFCMTDRPMHLSIHTKYEHFLCNIKTCTQLIPLFPGVIMYMCTRTSTHCYIRNYNFPVVLQKIGYPYMEFKNPTKSLIHRCH